jgi:hypothetical protein
MALLMLTALLLLAWGASRDRGGPLWRWLVLAPAVWLDAVRPRDLIALALFLLIGPLLTQMAMPGLAMVLAVDLAAWIELTAAVLIVARLAPGWRTLRATVVRAMKGWPARVRGAARRLAVRAVRRSPARRPPGRTGPDEDGAGWAFA